MAYKQAKFEHDDYVMVRRPLMALNFLNQTLNQFKELKETDYRQKISIIAKNEVFMQALKLVNSALYERIVEIPSASDNGEDLFITLMKYLIRTTTRATPFSCLAAVGKGKIGAVGIGDIQPAIYCRSEIDNFLFYRLLNSLLPKIKIQNETLVNLNPTFYKLGGEIRFYERIFKNDRFEFRLAQITNSQYLELIVEALSEPKQIQQISEMLLEIDEEISKEESIEYVLELIDAGFLSPNIDTQVIGGNILSNLLSSIELAHIELKQEDQDFISAAQEIINFGCNQDIKTTYQRVRQFEDLLRLKGHSVVAGKSMHVDSYLNTSKFTFPTKIVDEVGSAIETLSFLMAHRRNESLKKFGISLENRFGDRFIPLADALDPECGIPFGFSASVSYWSDEIGIHPKEKLELSSEKGFQNYLLSKLTFNSDEIDISDLQMSSNQQASVDKCVESCSVSVSLFNYEEGSENDNSLTLINFVNGPGSSNIIARFAGRDLPLCKAIQESVKQDDLCAPNVLFADIVHTPHPRSLNVLARPLLREYQIIISGNSSVPRNKQILLNDLYVAYQNGEIILWSKRFNKRVIPCLTSAHNFYGINNLGVYQFLSEIAAQDNTLPTFDWPSSFDGMVKLPRVTHGRVILKLGQWKISQQNLEAIQKSCVAKNWSELRKKFSELGIPESFSIKQFDQILEINTKYSESLLVFSKVIKGLSFVQIIESPSRIGRPYVSHNGINWHSEIVIPFRKKTTNRKKEKILQFDIQSGNRVDDNDLTRWSYLKIYGSEQFLETLLSSKLFQMLSNGFLTGEIKKWFFIRYRDPDFHIRLRIYGKSKDISQFMNLIFDDVLHPLHSTNQIGAINSEIYLPELNRYGGESLMPFIESIFFVDSIFCAEVIGASKFDQNNEIIWQAAICGTIQLFKVLGFSLNEMKACAISIRENFLSEMNVQEVHFDRLGKMYRKHRLFIESVISNSATHSESLSQLLKLREERISQILTEIQSSTDHELLLEKLRNCFASLAHMHMNRLFSNGSRPQEFIIWDFIVRAIRSNEARGVKL